MLRDVLQVIFRRTTGRTDRGRTTTTGRTTGRTDGQRTDDDDGRTWTDGRTEDGRRRRDGRRDARTDRGRTTTTDGRGRTDGQRTDGRTDGTDGRTQGDDDDGTRRDTTGRTERGYSFLYDNKISSRTLGPTFKRHNKSTVYPTFSTPTIKSRRIGYTGPQGLSSEEVYSSKATTSIFVKTRCLD